MKLSLRSLAQVVFGLATLAVVATADLPPVPKVPDELRELMQDRKYDDAVEAIDKLLDGKPAGADYLTYLKGRSQQLAGKHREALATFVRIERDFGDSPWLRRAKFGQAAAHLKLGDFEAAEQIYEEEVRFLLSTERKHEIASIYLEFADAYFQPPDKDKKPDYAKALNFYKKALEVGPNPERRIEVEFRVARCHQELGQHAEAAAAYQAFLKAHVRSPLDIEARYQLGVVQLALGQHVEARKTWKDLLDARTDEKSDRLAEAAYQIAHTYGLPQAPSKEDLELAVAAAQRFIASYPDHKLAPKAALEIAQGYIVHNRQEEAVAALKKLLADPKYAKADVLPDARVLLGFAYQRQKKFTEAVAAWQEYLAKHPAHQSWSQVQQAIIDTEFLTALEARREAARVGQAFQPDAPAPQPDARNAAEGQARKPDVLYAEARKLWDAFLARYPLDPRAASIMLEFGLMNYEQAEVGAPPLGGKKEPAEAGTPTKKFDAAIADWTNLVSKYPGTEESSRGQYLIGVTYEEKLTKFDDALAAYRKLNWGQFAPRAQERINRLTRQELAVVTERVFRTNQKPRVKVTTRNIKQLAVKAYRVDLETYFRKMHLASGIEGLDIGLIDPDKSWTFEVPDYADHKQLASEIEIPLDGPGVMAVTVANDPKPTETAPAGITVRPQEATTMVVLSDLDILVKCSRNELFVFAENLRTGKPFSGVKLLVSDGSKVFAEGITNDDGVFIGAVADGDKTWEPLKSSNDIRVFALTERAATDLKKEQGAHRERIIGIEQEIEELMRKADMLAHEKVAIGREFEVYKTRQHREIDKLRREIERLQRAVPDDKFGAEDKALRVSEKFAVKNNKSRLTAEGAEDRREDVQIKQDDNEQEPPQTVSVAHFASNVVGLKGVEFAQGIAAKGYIYTDRPTYRGGQLVHVRGVVRWVKGDEYFFEPGKKFKLDVFDSRGRQIRTEEVALGEFGSFGTRFVLPPEAPQGQYRLHVHDPAEPDRHNYQGNFTVHEYQLQPVQIVIDTPRRVYYRGEEVSGTIRLRYYYGSPVAEREIKYVLPDGTAHTAQTDAAGEVAFKFDTREFREDQVLTVAVQYPEQNLQSGLNLFLATRGFRAAVATARDVYISGETFDVTVSTTDAAGKKTGEKMTLAVVQRTEVQGQVGEKTVQERAVATDKETGEGRATIKIAAAGTYILRASGTDRFGNPVSADRTITVSGDDDTVRLRILADGHHFKAGDTAEVTLHWRNDPALALVTYQGARVLGYRLVELKKGTNKLEIPVTEKLAPNFDLVVSVMADSGARPAERKVLAKLEVPVTLQFVDTPLSDVVEFLRDYTKLHVALDTESMRVAGVTSASTVTIEVEEVALKTALAQLLSQHKLAYVAEDETVRITTEAQAKRQARDSGEIELADLPTFHEASSPFEVERPLRVTLKPSRDRVQPGDEVEVAITATDPQGKPVKAELSLAMIEKSLLELFPDPLAPIAQFFEGARRTSSLRTVASCTFRYAPSTRAISETLIAEAERVAVVELERRSREMDRNGEVAARLGDAPVEEEALGSTFTPNMYVDHEDDFSLGQSLLGVGVNSDAGLLGNRISGGAMAGMGGGGGGFAGPAGRPQARRSGIAGQAQERADVLALRFKGNVEQQLKQQLAAKQSKQEALLESMASVDRAAIPFGVDSNVDLLARTWNAPAEGRTKSLSRSGVEVLSKIPYAVNAEQLQWFARSLTDNEPELRKHRTQLSLLTPYGTTQFVDARAVAEGKLAELARGGVTLLPDFQMRETGYWNPSVVTDDEGQATLSITVPDRSTAWQLAARGITAGTLSGQATAELVAKKDLFGELKLPLAFVDGDSAQILATVHNDAVAKGKIEVTLKSTIAGKTREETKTIDIQSKGTHEVVFDREIAGTGEAVFELTVRGQASPAAAKSQEDDRADEPRADDPSPPAPLPQGARGAEKLPLPSEGEGRGEGAARVDDEGQAGQKENPAAVLEDTFRAVVPVRPYGIPVYATAGGTASSDMTAWISPPAGMPVRDPALQIVIGPSVERSLMDVVLGSGGGHFGEFYRDRLLVCDSALERTTSDLMAALGLMKLIGGTREKGSPEAAALADRVRSSVGFLVSSQNDDGGWSWSGVALPKGVASDRNATARALWALSLARKAGFAAPDDNFNKATTFVQTAFTAARENDYDGKSLLLHALSTAGRGDFAYANRLYRSRAGLSPQALVYLALAFVELDRKEIARELLDVLAPKLADVGAASRAATALGAGLPTPPKPEETSGRAGGSVGDRPQQSAEVRALYLLALNQIMPGDAKVKAAADWLMAHRAGSRWQPERATGPAVLGLADYFAQARFAAEHYTLKVFVNDTKVAELDFDGAAGTRVVDVPRELLGRGEKLPEKDYPGDARKQRINFELVGRGRFTFNCVLAGFVPADQLKSTTNAYHVEQYYDPAPLELDGREVPRGFDVLTGPFNTWRNPMTELPVGRRAEVRLIYYPINGHLIPEDQREYVVITQPIPSGCTVLEKSIAGQFDRYEIGPGYITFYVGTRSQPNEIRFDLYGYLPGKYRAAPTVIRNFYDPERMMVTPPRALTVLAAGQKSKDEYRLTPRELYELGKRLLARSRSAGVPPAPEPNADVNAEEGRRAARTTDIGIANEHLTELFDKFQLRPEIYKEVAQMLLDISLEIGKAPAIVRYFEVIKEKYPDLEIPFDQIVKVGAAYRELNEYERSYLVFRATAEGSFVRESEVGGFLESQGEFVRSVAVMDRILREYPAEPYVASATFALAQRVYAMAPNAAGDAKLREKRITRVDLIRDAIHRMDGFLTVWPDDPAADQASFSIASALVELEQWKDALARSDRFAERYPKSQFLDSFWYIMGYSHFALGDHRDALELCQRVAEAKRLDPATGREVESANKWRAIYIRGQVFHSRSEPADAIAEYERVGDRFPDAREAIAYFTRKAIELPEITTVKPGDDAATELKFRNVAGCEVKVYRIDLLKFSLLQRDLSNITKINLAGIRPLHEAKIELGDGKDYRDRTRKLELPVDEEGAYLVVCRGEDLHTSGLVLVTPLVVDVQEEPSSGRVRVTVKNTVDDKYAPEVHVKVIGSRNDRFKDGQTDLRGIYTTDGVQGRSTVIARAGDAQYAFHRGQLELGPPPATPVQSAIPAAKAPEAAKAKPDARAGDAQNEMLRDLIEGNRAIQQQKGKELKELYDQKSKGVKAQKAF